MKPEKVDSSKGMTPNTAQRRPDEPKHSLPKPFKLSAGK
jgi:hypothetical protein